MNPRRLTAPLSVVILIIVAGLAFTHLQELQSGPEYLQPILDPQFDLWVSDANLGGSRPMVWDVAYDKGPGDQIALRQTMVAGRRTLEIQVFQDGVDGRWAYVYLRQTLDGARLAALFDSVVDVWVYQESPCVCEGRTTSQTTIFGLEIDDWPHALTFIFSQDKTETQQLLGRRTVYLASPVGEWVYRQIDLAREYRDVGWKRPERLTFSIILGAPSSAVGWHLGYVQGFSIARKTNPTSTEGESVQVTLIPKVPETQPQRSLDRRVEANMKVTRV